MVRDHGHENYVHENDVHDGLLLCAASDLEIDSCTVPSGLARFSIMLRDLVDMLLRDLETLLHRGILSGSRVTWEKLCVYLGSLSVCA